VNLYVQQWGSGPDIVMLHGWGLHGGVFTTMAERLASHFRVSLIDLPGHGRSLPAQHPLDLAALTEAVATVAPPSAIWLGWSLGGIVATQLALTSPQRVKKLILVCSSPRFANDHDWPCAMDPAVLGGFAQALHEDYRRTLERFLSLQITPGTAAGRDTLRRLRQVLLQSPPSAPALGDGLAILRSADMRTRLPSLSLPVLSILGGRDRLVPATIAPALKELLPAMRIEVIKGAGHVPFLSHPQKFLTALCDFLETHHD
jgi:pimeloyl-[acyl-carrier protein] methyl ester esterase